MTRTVLVTPQIPLAFQCGGIGTFVYNFARILKSAGHDLTILYTEPPQKPETEWMPHYEQLGVRIKSVMKYSARGGYTIDMPRAYPLGYHLYVRLSELVAEQIPPETDIVYFADWRANGLHLARSKRYTEKKLPLVVTVLHGTTGWHREGMQLWPTTYDDLAIDFMERYVFEHSDFGVFPSRYTADWAKGKGWNIPDRDRSRVLLYPFLPNPAWLDRPIEHADRFRRIVLYGRLETRKGLDLFVESLRKLKGDPCLAGVEEIVLLGGPGGNIYGNMWVGPNIAAELIEKELKIRSHTIMDLDTFDAQGYLAERAADTLVVVPSRSETVGFTIIEASLMAGLNLICSNVGGIPEVLGLRGRDQLFEPHVEPMRRKLREWLERGPRPASELGRYRWEESNSSWLRFHEEMVGHARSLRPEQADSRRIPVASRPGNGRSVDVCIRHYNSGEYLPELLDSLEHQTSDEFSVFAVDDGSTDVDSIAVFERMKGRYEPRGWCFVSSANRGPSSARNLAASLGGAEYLCFVDAASVAARNMIERFLEAIRISGDDCLTCYFYAFKGRTPFISTRQSPSARILRPAHRIWAPVGNAPAPNILQNTFGDLNGIMRRAAFEEIGGFTEDCSKYVNQEDRELLTRLSFGGYKIEVIPEFLFYRRHGEDDRPDATQIFEDKLRVLRAYEEQLAKVRLEDLGPLLLGLHYWLHDKLGVTQPDAPLGIEADALAHHVDWYTMLKAMKRKFAEGKFRSTRDIAAAAWRETKDTLGLDKA